MLAGLLAYKCGPVFAALTGGAIGAYTAFTIGVTLWRTRFRQAMNAADAEAGKRAMDSLINYETVKLYGNEAHEQSRYDACLAGARPYLLSAIRVHVLVYAALSVTRLFSRI